MLVCGIDGQIESVSLWGGGSQSSRASGYTYCYRGVRHTRTSQLSAGPVGSEDCRRVESREGILGESGLSRVLKHQLWLEI